jgi:xanthine dehydrogenase accessory factor
VIDPREDWNSSQRFPTATERIVLSYEDFLSDFIPSPADYVVIVTQGHEHDEFILRQMTEHPLRYLGMIGSQRKISRTLRKLPPTSQWNAELHAPVGLDIGAETPNEIAVAIVAELIQTRKGKNVNTSNVQEASHVAAPALCSSPVKEIA